MRAKGQLICVRAHIVSPHCSCFVLQRGVSFNEQRSDNMSRNFFVNSYQSAGGSGTGVRAYLFVCLLICVRQKILRLLLFSRHKI